jgi:Ser/Thr protein kinase RdoA (MazF antagonist)
MNSEVKVSDIVMLLKGNYPDIFLSDFHAQQIQVSEFEQGFMNHVLKIELLNVENEVVSSYVGIFFNANRYSDDYAAKFLEEIDSVARYLRSRGLPAREAIEVSSNKYQVSREYRTLVEIGNGKNKRFFSLFELIPGKTISWEAYTRRHLRALGMYMGKMHSALRDIDIELSMIKNWSDHIVSDSENLLEYLKKNKLFIEKKLSLKLDFSKIENAVFNVSSFACPYMDPDLRPQLIHCDFVRGNILFSDVKSDLIYQISGILDFEKMLFGKVEIDVARTLAFLFVDCKYKSEEDIIKYFLNEGYNTLGTVDTRQQKILFSNLENYMIYFWLRDFWKFLECNPYEDLRKNEHYVRTVKQLLIRKLVI